MAAKVDVLKLTARPARRPSQYTVAPNARRAPLGDGTYSVRATHKIDGESLALVDGSKIIGVPLAAVTCAILHGVVTRDEVEALWAAAEAAK